MRCCAHIVNLIVSEGLKEKHDSIAIIRDVVRYVRSSPSMLKRLKEVVIEEGIECKGLISLDVQTRWNSTYLMLNCALKFQKTFESLMSNANFLKYFDEDEKDGKKKERPPTETDWENTKVFVKFLETFYEVTLRFIGSTYVMIDNYFVEICNMQRTLYRMAVEEDDLFLKKYASLHDEFVQQRKEEDGGKTENEVDRYLTEEAEPMIEDENFDILKWWDENASKYKILSTIVRDVLSKPVTTWSSSHQPFIVRDYMDEVKVPETSEILESKITSDSATVSASENIFASPSPSGSVNAPYTASSAAQGTE
ncbi:zinc finger BED domain-containing protein RICESLEEPER 2-like [Humulus lupulus]|uniref:zinc finger BED domain-containing protein RICESLEEPER 2-like n=1 Tax=Humulus lupulus TaxID=3486 RepID=UPI002B406229|nr:zinc finger BED domain-containing protein RICESLEEPER 2-like [Humulus lupulus]